MLALLFLALITFIYSDSSDECSGFLNAVKSGCEALSPSSTPKCVYSENQCISGYTECTQYTPAAGSFDDATCTKIIPSDSKYKCVVNGKGTSKTCSQELKSCSECSAITDCTSLKAGENQRCLLVENERCEAHYQDCASLTSQGQTKCEANIPNDKTKMCSWSSNTCGPVDRTCEKYIFYYGPNDEDSRSCSDLKSTSEKKICIFENGKTCREEYEKCDNGNENKELCNTIKPLNSEKTGYDHLYICKYPEDDSGTASCTKELKKCTEYIKNFDNEDVCPLLTASNENKLCSYDDSKDECSEIYKTCNSYNLVVTDPTKRQMATCEAITYRDSYGRVDPLYECYLADDKSCKERRKSCSKLLTESLCESQVLDDTTKKCLFVNNECKEVYKTCSDYTTKVEAANRKKEDCEVIIYQDINNYYIYNCTFDGKENLNKCEEKKFQCEDYKGQDERFCQALSINIDTSDQDKFECKFIEGKCIKQYRTCESYKGYSKKICESIPTSLTLDKCILEHDKTCKSERKACSEYTGKSESECSSYKASTDKVCGIVNGKCTEKSTTTINYCSDYRGTSREECESIQPFYTDSGQVDRSSRCVFVEEGCIKESKKCSDATSELECSYITPPNDEDNKKQCAFVNNECVEQYRTCQIYNTEEEATKFSQNGCESIVNNESGYPFSKYRCKFTAPSAGQTKGTCTHQLRTCSEFRPELVKNQCSSISPSDITKKCVFNNNDNSCTSKAKTCLDLETLTPAPNNLDDICENASVSSDNKVCSATQDRNGCHEIDKETNVPNPEDNPNENGNNNNDNSSGMNHLSKIILILIYLLF